MRVSVGDKFGRLQVKELIPHRKNPKALCVCDCGALVRPQRGALLNGRAKSCGCLRTELLAAHVDSVRLPEDEAKKRKIACQKSWVERNRLRAREINRRATRKFYTENPEAAAENCRARRARRLSLQGHVSPGIKEALIDVQLGLCLICNSTISLKGSHLDHVVPLCRGGRHEDTNLEVLCASCNLSKGSKLMSEFLSKEKFDVWQRAHERTFLLLWERGLIGVMK